ncbi:hypothetical protein OEZ85_003077 [Tetradesmus obliquus]|uniref:Uncharacterized protein n=1 Tax=Tetradesmus obliquus TaxID=3088 RepID=A0ABY8TZN9_TETOB|nr:hypothetical protein OEZ85_003077 [Tetradesmus obliquus]
MGLLLHLGSLEHEFYASPGCLRVYTRWDALGLLYAVFLNTALLRTIRQHLLNPDMWYFTVQFAIYGCSTAPWRSCQSCTICCSRRAAHLALLCIGAACCYGEAALVPHWQQA